MGSTRYPRVVHIIPALTAGGAESVVDALVVGRCKLGRPTGVIAILPAGSTAPHPFVTKLRGQGIPISEVRCGHRAYWAEGDAVTRQARALGAELIHTHKLRGNLAGYVAARRLRLPVVATVHGYGRSNLRGWLYELFDRRLLLLFDRVICVSEALRCQLETAGIASDRLHSIPNGDLAPRFVSRTEARSALGLPEHATIVGWVGRLDQSKGPDLAVQLAPALVQANAMLVIVGDGPWRDRVRASVARLGLGDREVRMLGEQAGAGALVPAFDLLCLTSRREGTPGVILEAMAAGVPVAALGVGGVPELVDDRCGWTVKPNDTQALTRVILDALGRPEERNRRASAARQRLASRFGRDQWLDRIETVYSRVTVSTRMQRLKRHSELSRRTFPDRHSHRG